MSEPTVEEIRARHRDERGSCAWDGQVWPCDAELLGRWLGQCWPPEGYVLMKRDSEPCVIHSWSLDPRAPCMVCGAVQPVERDGQPTPDMPEANNRGARRGYYASKVAKYRYRHHTCSRCGALGHFPDVHGSDREARGPMVGRCDLCDVWLCYPCYQAHKEANDE